MGQKAFGTSAENAEVWVTVSVRISTQKSMNIRTICWNIR